MVSAGYLRVVAAWAACLLAMGAASAQSLHVMTPTDIASLRLVGDARIAPDGEHVIYSVRTPEDPAKLGPTRLWIVATGHAGHAAPLPAARSGDTAARWSPDGRSIAFLSDRQAASPSGKPAPASVQIWLTTPDAVSARLVAHLPGPVSDFRWSKDGARIAALVQEKPPSPAPASGVIEAGQHAPVTRVYLIDVANGTARPVTPWDRFVFDVDWAPSGKQLVVRAGAGPGLDYFWYDSRVAVLDLPSGQWTVLPHRATALHPSFSPDGSRVVYGFFDDNGITGDTAVYDLRSRKSLPLGKGWKGSLRDLQWDAGGTRLTALGFVDLSPCFVEVDAHSGEVTPRFSIKGDPYDFTRSSAGSLAFVASTRRQPEEVWLADGNQARVITDTNPQVRGWRLGTLQTVQWRSRHDGTKLEGLLMLPAGFAPGHPVRTLVQIHGGPYDAWSDGWLGSWHNWAQLLSAHGYAVFMPNPRGSDGRGEAFATANIGDWGGGDFQDVLDGVDALEKQGIIDPSRVAIGGWSYGGYMSAWAAGHPDPFKTAIVGAAITDISSMALTTDVGYSFIPPYFGDPIRERARYEAHSPLTFVHDVHMPVLIMHGEHDQRVPIFQGEMFYNALRHQGTPVEMIRYPGAPHWFGGSVSPAYEEDVQQRVLDWLNRYLPPSSQGKAG